MWALAVVVFGVGTWVVVIVIVIVIVVVVAKSAWTSSDSISPHVSGWVVVVVANLVQPTLVGATWMMLPRRVG